ncbi:AB22G-like protein [Mya arenaria]|uniref:AB22G-like protein n=1 Tax=Mya arenaria TaxID=6604 RepID=A0ABY7DV89_MYAAR|nr:AB22G-like protein [Mya arenaria]
MSPVQHEVAQSLQLWDPQGRELNTQDGRNNVVSTTWLLFRVRKSPTPTDHTAIFLLLRVKDANSTSAGKTTLLNVISGRQKLTSGEITLSGVQFGKQLRRRLGFVLQSDVLFSNLTLWETLYFTAMIRLPESVSKEDKLQRLEEIIDALDIQKCRNTVIGDNFVRGLSGGEKKRASIASELLTDPDILLLDEPTSGLDSTIALSLINQLKGVASCYNKTVIVTIHQPSSQIYHLFDALLLLSHGQVAYFGEAHEKPLEFMEKLVAVLKLEKTKLDELVQMNKTEQLIQPCKGKDNAAFIDENERNADVKVKAGDLYVLPTKHNAQNTQAKWPTNVWTQFRMLSWRNYKQSKSRIFEYHDLIYFAVTAAVCGVLFFQIPKDADVFRDRMVPTERCIILKERAGGAYRLSAYYFAKTVSELPLTLVVPSLFYTFVFWMSGLGNVRQFFMTWPIFMLSVFRAQGLGMLIGAFFTNMSVAMLVGNIVIIISMLFSGFITQKIPWWMDWARYISQIQYPLSAITIITLQGLEPISCQYPSVSLYPTCLYDINATVTSSDILKEAGIVLPLHCYISMLACLLVILRVLVYIVLRVRR